jgi:large subunit ribosomal protein L17
MRHGVSGRKLNRVTSHRLAMFRNMVTSLLRHERIYTTVPKAKELRRWAEWMITLGKQGDLHAKRQALSLIQEKSVVYKLFEDLAPRYQSRPGGYTRIVKVGFRRGDASPMCIIELVSDANAVPKKAKPTEGAESKTPVSPQPAAAPEAPVEQSS